MSRRLLASALALALSPTLALPATLAQGSVPAASNASAAADIAETAAARAPARTFTKRVRLGHRPARILSEDRVRLVFRGKKGRLVNLARWGAYGPPSGKRVLRHQGRRVKQFAEGYWRLPRTGRYVAVFTSDDDTRGRVQVRRTVIRRATVDSGEVRVGRRHDVTHLLAVRVRGPVTVHVAGADPRASHVILPDRQTVEPMGFSSAISLQPGTPPHTTLSDSLGAPLSTAGRHLLALLPSSTAQVQSVAQHATTTDGAAVVLDERGTDVRRDLVTFAGQAGQWIHTETARITGPVGQRQLILIGPDGRPVTHVVSAFCAPEEKDCPRDALAWRLPDSGTYQLSVLQGPGTDAVRVRTAAQAEPITLGGPPVTYASTTPGQWVIGTIPAPGAVTPRLTATNASESLTRFRATAVSGWIPLCGVYDTSNGCPDYSILTVTQDQPSDEDWWITRMNPVIVLQVPPNVSGSVDLSFP